MNSRQQKIYNELGPAGKKRFDELFSENPNNDNIDNYLMKAKFEDFVDEPEIHDVRKDPPYPDDKGGELGWLEIYNAILKKLKVWGDSEMPDLFAGIGYLIVNAIDIISSTIQSIRDGLRYIGEKIGDAADWVASKAKTAWDYIRDLFS